MLIYSWRKSQQKTTKTADQVATSQWLKLPNPKSRQEISPIVALVGQCLMKTNFFCWWFNIFFDSFRQQASVETAVLWDETEVYVSQRMFLFCVYKFFRKLPFQPDYTNIDVFQSFFRKKKKMEPMLVWAPLLSCKFRVQIEIQYSIISSQHTFFTVYIVYMYKSIRIFHVHTCMYI